MRIDPSLQTVRARSLTAAALALALVACTAPTAQTPATGSAEPVGGPTSSDAFAFVNVTVIPMDRERALSDQTVIVRHGRIAAIGPADELEPPSGARVVDGTGRYLIPGLAEMHAHLPGPQQGAEALERTLFLYLSNGVTTVRGMLGHPTHLDVRGQAERGEILSPRIYTSGPSINGSSAPTVDVGVRMVEEQAAAGYDLLKIHPGLGREVFDAVAAAAAREGIPFAGHVPADVGLNRALEVGMASIDHLDGYLEALAGYGDGWPANESGFFGFALVDRADTARIADLADATRAGGVWNVPTQSLMEHLLSPEDPKAMARRPEMRYMPRQTVERWAEIKQERMAAEGYTPERAARYIDVRRRLIHALHRADAGLILGSDAPQMWNVPGFAIQHELGMLVAAGLTPYEALQTGTRNPAVYFGAADWGTIAEGSAADLILLEDDPLADIGNVARRAGVMVRGRWLPETEIRQRLARIAADLGH